MQDDSTRNKKVDKPEATAHGSNFNTNLNEEQPQTSGHTYHMDIDLPRSIFLRTYSRKRSPYDVKPHEIENFGFSRIQTMSPKKKTTWRHSCDYH